MKGNRPLSESRLQRNGLPPGTPAPGFSLPRVGGGKVSLADYRGGRVLLVFSDPDCGPCNELAPELADVSRRLPDLQVLMVSRGDEARNLSKIQQYNLPFAVVLQKQWEVSRLYAMFATPIAYLIDEQGVIVSNVAFGSVAIHQLMASFAHPPPEYPGAPQMTNPSGRSPSGDSTAPSLTSSDTIESLTMQVINVALQSPAVQNYAFKVTAGCQDSVLNDIFFCNAVEVTDTYDVSSVIDQACVDACKGIQDGANAVCDATRETCKTGCSALKGSYDACCGTCDAARKTCKTGCLGIKSCENACDDASKKCKDGCGKTFPYDSCNSACDSASASCKDAAQSGYNACVSGCGYIMLTGGYDIRLVEVGGLGSIAVTNVSDITVTPADQNVSTLSLALIVPSTAVQVHYNVWQDPIPPITGTLPIVVNNVAGRGTATLSRVRQGDASGRAPGYYVQIDNLEIVIPSDIFDYSPWILFLQALGIDTSNITNGIDALYGMFMQYVDGKLSKTLVKELNQILFTMKIMDCAC